MEGNGTLHDFKLLKAGFIRLTVAFSLLLLFLRRPCAPEPRCRTLPCFVAERTLRPLEALVEQTALHGCKDESGNAHSSYDSCCPGTLHI